MHKPPTDPIRSAVAMVPSVGELSIPPAIPPKPHTPNPKPLYPSAFTIIEMLVVVGIIVLLISLIMVGINSWQNSAMTNTTRLVLRNLEHISDQWSKDNGGLIMQGPKTIPDYIAHYNNQNKGADIRGPYYPSYETPTASATVTPTPPSGVSTLQIPLAPDPVNGFQVSGGSSSSILNADVKYYINAVNNSMAFCAYTIDSTRFPNVAELYNSLPAKTLVTQDASIYFAPATPAAKAIIVDPWGNPIIYVGWYDYTQDPTVGEDGSKPPQTLPCPFFPRVVHNRPFFVSSGSLGRFNYVSSRTIGVMNPPFIYSFGEVNVP